MATFEDKTFSVVMGASTSYRDNFERVFRGQQVTVAPATEQTPSEVAPDLRCDAFEIEGDSYCHRCGRRIKPGTLATVRCHRPI